MTAHPSGQQFEIRAGDYRATVVEVGAGLRTLRLGDTPMIEGYAPDAVCDGARGNLLIPWPNRVDGGRYRFAGSDRQLDLTEPSGNCAIHGLTRWANWRIADHGPSRVRLVHRLHPHPGWPHVLDLEAVYTLDAAEGLTVAVRASNVGDAAAPYGIGAHPYLIVDTLTVDDCLLTLPAATHLTVDARGLPTGREDVAGTPYDFREARPVGSLALDDPFGDLARDGQGRAWAHLQSPAGRTVSLWVDAHHHYLQVFTGDHLSDPARRRSALAIEPMTCPANAYVSGDGLVVLEPGEALRTTWGLRGTPPA